MKTELVRLVQAGILCLGPFISLSIDGWTETSMIFYSGICIGVVASMVTVIFTSE